MSKIIEILTAENNYPVFIKNNEDNKGTVFYIGMGKTGSFTLCNSIKDVNIFHIHGEDDINIYYNNIITEYNINIYNLIELFGKELSYKPLLIQNIREPVSLLLSLIFEFTKGNFEAKHSYCEVIPLELIYEYNQNKTISSKAETIAKIFNCICEKFDKPFFDIYHQEIINKENIKFNIEEGFVYSELKDFSMLILKFENIRNWKTILNNIGINYEETPINLSSDYDFYDISKYIKDNPKILNLTRDYLKDWYNYNDCYLYNYYSEKEIDNFINKWSI